MCDHRRLDDPNGLPCVREDCDGKGHIYKATAGPDLDQGRRHAQEDSQ